MAANVSVVHDVPEPGEARRRHVRAFFMIYIFHRLRGKAARKRGRCVK
jgi:hypothetical protein